MSLQRIEGPDEEPLTLDELKAHLRVIHRNEDALIEGYLQAARELVEKLTGAALITQRWQLRLDAFRPCIDVWLFPVQRIEKIEYINSTNERTEFDLDQARLLADKPARIVPVHGERWPATLTVPGAVQITLKAGWEDPEAVPMPFRQAILLLAGHWYANREAVSDQAMHEIPMGIKALLSQYRL